jgi:hypothetical protein
MAELLIMLSLVVELVAAEEEVALLAEVVVALVDMYLILVCVLILAPII